jgi:hypothetical protein
MDTLAQLEKYSNDLSEAVQSFADTLRKTSQVPLSGFMFDSIAHKGLQRAKQTILSNVSKIKAAVCEPADLLAHLANQVSKAYC